MAAAVILSPRDAQDGPGPWVLDGARIDDSKRLSPAQRERARRVILARAEVSVGIVPAEIIDRLGILSATFEAMRQAVEALPAPPDMALIDGTMAPPLTIPSRCLIGGDGRSLPIACASIMAKTLRDSLMGFYHRLFPDWSFDRHKGYGTALHRAALLACGPSFLHRVSFQPIAQALECSPSA